MQVGDLVKLSAAGKKIRQNAAVINSIGIIVHIKNRERHRYQIHWCVKDDSGLPESGMLPMSRYEIKKVRGAK